MKQMMKLLVVVAVVLTVAAPVLAETNFNFNGNSRMQLKVTNVSDGTKETSIAFSGRTFLAVNPKFTAEDGRFVEAYGELLLKSAGIDSGDMYLQVGTPNFNVKAGNVGGDDGAVTGNDILDYGDNDYRYLLNYAKDGEGVLAFNVKMGENIALNWANAFKPTTMHKVAVNGLGTRPMITVKAGNFTVAAGGEYMLYQPKDTDLDGKTTKLGFGGHVEMAMGNISAGIGALSGTVSEDTYVAGEADPEDMTTTTIIGHMEVAKLMEKDTLGLQVSYSKQEDDKQIAGFVAYYHPMFVDGFQIRMAVSFASLEPNVGDKVNSVGGLFRLQYNY